MRYEQASFNPLHRATAWGMGVLPLVKRLLLARGISWRTKDTNPDFLTGDFMSKRDRERRRKRRSAVRGLSADLAIASPTREPNGRPQRATREERRVKPSSVQKKRQAAMRGLPGTADDWIDYAGAQGFLPRRQADALRRYRGLIESYRRAIEAPTDANDILAGLMPQNVSAFYEQDEDAVRQIRHRLDDARASLNELPRRQAETLEAHICGTAMPLPRAMAMIAVCAEVLAEWFGV